MARVQTHNTVDLDILDELTGYHLRRTQLKYYRDFASSIGKLKITPTQFAILVLIQKNPGLSQLALGTTLNMAKPAIMAILNKLETRSLVTRKQSPQDGRVRALYLTSRGEKEIRALRTKVIKIDNTQTRNLTLKERKELRKLLLKMQSEKN